jgi:hypothetical protein
MRREQIIGKNGEQTARSVLHGLGLEMIEKVGTPVRLIPVSQKISRNDPRAAYHVIFGEKVAADHRAMFPDGCSVLIEVKTVYDRNLVWSDLREHQPGKLSQHTALNGLSLLVWVHDSGVYVMRWPVDGFRPGKGITPHQAAVHHDRTLQYIQDRLTGIEHKFAMEAA